MTMQSVRIFGVSFFFKRQSDRKCFCPVALWCVSSVWKHVQILCCHIKLAFPLICTCLYLDFRVERGIYNVQINETTFVGGVVFVVVLFFYLYVVIILRARHDHNKIATCGIIKVLFFTELN